MTIGMNTINRIRDVENLAKSCGFKFSMPSDRSRTTDVIALCPIDDEYPIYRIREELFVGTLDELALMLKGMIWMKEYLIKIKAVSPEHIAKKEQSVRNKALVKLLQK